MSAAPIPVPTDARDPAQVRRCFNAVADRLRVLDLGILNATSGAPTDTPAVRTARNDEATDTLWVFGSGGWKSVVLT